MAIHPGFLIAGGVGVLGLGGYALFKGNDKPKEGADPASKDPATGTDAGRPTGAATGTVPTAGTPDPATGSATGATEVGAEPQGRQVGPYTIIADESGTQIVFETATKQPVGILDEQGNLVPITIDANGKMSIAPQGATSVGPGLGTGATTGGTANTSPTAGSQAGAVGSGALPGASQAGVEPQGRQVGPYTIIADESGTQIVFETATKQPVGILDEQGNLVPVTIDANGKMSIDSSAQSVPTGAGVGQAAISGAQQGVDLSESGRAIGGGGAQSAAEGEQLVRTPFGMISQTEMSSIVDQAIADVLDDPSGVATSQPTAGVTAAGQGTSPQASSPVGGGGQNAQVQGGYTVVDDGSGNQVVVDVATQTPVGILDQRGNIVPLNTGAGAGSQG